MHEPNPREISFASRERGIRVTEGSSYRGSTVYNYNNKNDEKLRKSPFVSDKSH